MSNNRMHPNGPGDVLETVTFSEVKNADYMELYKRTLMERTELEEELLVRDNAIKMLNEQLDMREDQLLKIVPYLVKHLEMRLL